MAIRGEDVSRWDQARLLGQVLMCGFDGTEVNDEIRTLIEHLHVGAIFLAPKNLRSATQATKLCLDLQGIARAAGHIFPLLIVIDQENGGLNSLSDTSLIHEFPSNLGIAATSSRSLTRQVAKATAQELKAVGINLILGPVLDVISDTHSQVLGPRSFGENPEEVSALGHQYINGCRDAGLASCGKHFPSFEKLELLRATPVSPPINGSLRDLSRTSLAPFRDAIAQGVDAILVGDVAVNLSDMSEMHACLSERVVDGLLRRDMQFGGVVVSECLELSLSRDIGIQGAAVMGLRAGCDLVMVCRSLSLQSEALQGLELGLEGGTLETSKLQASVSRIIELKSRCTSWHAALNPSGVQGLSALRRSHQELSKTAYSRSITVVRDSKSQLPLTKHIAKDQPVLLLTPLITPLPSSNYHSQEGAAPDMRSSELVFQRFGAILGKHASTKVIHTSYSAHGVRPRHEEFIDQAVAVIVITADANRNKYQSAFAKHVTLLCGQRKGTFDEKTCVVVAVTSPYDFAADVSADPYVCTYDYTETALKSLARVLCGELRAEGKLPKVFTPAKTNITRQQWLVEKFNYERDGTSLTNLLTSIRSEPDSVHVGLDHVSAEGFVLESGSVENHHFVVRNSSTKELFGFCAAYYVKASSSGYLGLLVVDPRRRRQSIGSSLHARAIQALEQRAGITILRLGFAIPATLPGVSLITGNQRTIQWLDRRGWIFSGHASRHYRTVLLDFVGWKAPEGLSRSLTLAEIKYEIIQGGQDHAGGVFEHVNSNSSPIIAALYSLVLTEKAHTAVIRAKSLRDGSIVGIILACGHGSVYTQGMPVNAGILLGPAVSRENEFESTIMQSLILLGLKHLKKQGAEVVLLEEQGTSQSHLLEQWALPSMQVFEYETAVRPIESS